MNLNKGGILTFEMVRQCIMGEGVMPFKEDTTKSQSFVGVIVKTCSDIFYTIGQKKCPMPSAKIRNYSHSHNLVS